MLLSPEFASVDVQYTCRITNRSRPNQQHSPFEYTLPTQRRASMTDLQLVFFLGPLYFFSRLLQFGSIESLDPIVFLTSALGTTFWVVVVSTIAGLLQ
jgi:hypothetical protein